MRIRIASFTLLAFLASSVPAYGLFDLFASYSVKIDGLKDAAKALERFTKLVDELSDDDPNKGRLKKLLAMVKKDLEDLIDKAAKTLKETGQDMTKDLLEK